MSTILLADDNSNIQKMVSLALKDQGINVVAVGNGEAAVRKLRDMIPDLILADIFMPVRTGYEVCEFVKTDKRLAHVPVVLLAGAFDPFDQNEAERVGANGVLKKPFVPPDPLVNLVKSLLPKPPEPAVDSSKGGFVSNKVESSWGSPLPSQAFTGTTADVTKSPATKPAVPFVPPAPAPLQSQPMASVQTESAASKPIAVQEEFPEPADEELAQYTRQASPDLLDEMLERETEKQAGKGLKPGGFGGVSAFPDLVEAESPKSPEKNKFAPKPPTNDGFADHHWPSQAAAVEEVEEVMEAERPKSFRPSFLDTVDEAAVEAEAKRKKLQAKAKPSIELPKGMNIPAPAETKSEPAAASSKTESLPDVLKPAAKSEPQIAWPSLDAPLPPSPAPVEAKAEPKPEAKKEEPVAVQPAASAPVAPATLEPPKTEAVKEEPAASLAEKIEASQPQWGSYSSVAAELDKAGVEKEEAAKQEAARQESAKQEAAKLEPAKKEETPAATAPQFSPWLPAPQTSTPDAINSALAAAAKSVEIPAVADAEIREAVKSALEESVANAVKEQISGSLSIDSHTSSGAAIDIFKSQSENKAAIIPFVPEKSATTDSNSEASSAKLSGGATDMATAEKAVVPIPMPASTLPSGAQNNELVAEISARVMERMRPQVIDVITKEILRPIVEALVKKEIDEK